MADILMYVRRNSISVMGGSPKGENWIRKNMVHTNGVVLGLHIELQKDLEQDFKNAGLTVDTK